jgi:Uroporphyrinogen decarboxylase (URO-D)
VLTYRQRILAALRGEPVDFVPWAPRWELFFDAARLAGRLPAKYEGWHIFDVTRDLGMGIKANRGSIFRLELTGVDVRTRQDGMDTITEYDTPHGTVRTVFRITPELEAEGVRGLEMEYLIKEREDYDPVYYMVEHTRVVPTHEVYAAYDAQVGEDGLAFPNVGPSPMHKVQREYTGYQQSYFELSDNLPQVERLTEMLQAQFDQITQIAAESVAPAVEADGNYDISLHPPSFFERWFHAPLKRFGDAMHSKGKLFITHTDGQTAGLLKPLMDTGVDVAEAWSPYPQTTLTTGEALDVWRGKVAIWGGLPTPVLCESFSDAEFERFFFQFLHEITPGSRVVIGTGDNFPTDSSFSRVRQVTRLVEEHCRYPIVPHRLPR